MYSVTVWHEGLGKYQVVRGHTVEEARAKAEMKKTAWNAQFARLAERESKRQTAEDRRAEREALKEEATERTAEAEQAIADLQGVLVSIVNASPRFRNSQAQNWC